LKRDDVFEVTDKDVLGRVGKLHTKSGTIETPCLLPVIHPTNQIVTPREMWEMGFKAVMTNAYLARKAFGPNVNKSIHELLNFQGVVATDSGAYQILTYGEIEANQTEIINFEEKIGSDIAVILDIPTGLTTDRKYAEMSVNETLRRADQTLRTVSRDDILWVGPIQGGTYLDLVARCAEEMNSRPFPILALGSPTQVMEQYMYRELVQMVLTCKKVIKPSCPLHLFGGGHPSMFALAVSVGCDLFDSASYAIYARKNRYLTPSGTIKIQDLEYLPCSCNVCGNLSAKELIDSPPHDKARKLSIHNLNICIEEIRRIKQSIIEGRLWELVMQRVRAHTRLLESIHEFKNYRDLFERHSPMTKKKGIFFFDHLDLNRPEVVRFKQRIDREYSPPENARILVLLPTPLTKPHSADKTLKRMLKLIDGLEAFHICFYGIPYGAVPIELSDVYPISQTEVNSHPDQVSIIDTAEAVAQYLRRHRYGKVLLHASKEALARRVLSRINDVCAKTGQKLSISYYGKDVWGTEALEELSSLLKTAKKRCTLPGQ